MQWISNYQNLYMVLGSIYTIQTIAATSSSQIPSDNLKKPLLSLYLHHIIKLNPTNYLSWKLQTEAILFGYDLLKFINGTYQSHSPTITTDEKETTNLDYNFWLRQDKLLIGALIGTLDHDLDYNWSSKALWDSLAHTYATPSHDNIKQLKDKIKNISKGSRSITEYMQSIKVCVDKHAALGKAMDDEDLVTLMLI